jgi:predicted transcriptional regulator YheO
MKAELKKSLPIAEMFARLLHPFAEVVVHDLEKDRIEAIYNPFSRREVGDDSYLDRWDFTVDPEENVIGPYEKTNYDDRRLKSISLVLRNDKGKATGFLCVNMDISVFENYRDTVQIFLSNNDTAIPEEKQSLFKDDLYEQINLFVQNYCREMHLSLDALSRDDKQVLILSLRKKGAFNGKNATSYIARILNVSRATVYNYLKEMEQAA